MVLKKQKHSEKKKCSVSSEDGDKHTAAASLNTYRIDPVPESMLKNMRAVSSRM